MADVNGEWLIVSGRYKILKVQLPSAVVKPDGGL